MKTTPKKTLTSKDLASISDVVSNLVSKPLAEYRKEIRKLKRENAKLADWESATRDLQKTLQLRNDQISALVKENASLTAALKAELNP